ncbi:unnamed protein product, partial [marine sediment metagenome]
MKYKKVKLLIESSRAYGRGLLLGIARYSHLHGPWSFVTEHAFYRRAKKKGPSAPEPDIDGIIAHINDIQKIKP